MRLRADKPFQRFVGQDARGRETVETWDELFGKAAYFPTEVGSEHVVGISHSADSGDGVVTVWYWTQADETENA